MTAWAMTAATAELTQTHNNLLKAIEEVEAKFRERSFLERALRTPPGE